MKEDDEEGEETMNGEIVPLKLSRLRVCSFVLWRLRSKINAREPILKLFVKAARGNSNQLGPCIYSQWILLVLEENGAPYIAELIDSTNKPSWYLQLNPEGCVPAVKLDGRWVSDPVMIADILAQKHCGGFFHNSDKGLNDFVSSCVEFLNKKEVSSLGRVLEGMKLLNDHLRANPFTKFSSRDALFAPILHQIEILRIHYRQTWPQELTFLGSYMELLFSLESFMKTKPSTRAVLEEWPNQTLVRDAAPL